MPMAFCPHCRGQVSIPAGDAGVACPHCAGFVKITGSATEAEAISPLPVHEQITVPPEHSKKHETAKAVVAGDEPVPPELVNHPRYRVLELLGRGGMGAVYKAEHQFMKRTVALKILNKELVANPSTVKRFHREVRAAASLHDPHIVTAHDADQAGDVHFLVMEYVPGTDLHKVLAEHGPLPIAQACAYVRQAALGLQHAMDNGMVHRDIKPQNLILTPQGEVKILDFGLASLNAEVLPAHRADATQVEGALASGLTQTGAIMGTPDYMAPEQARDAHAADIRADIYSLGCTLYHLLTGTVPFPGGTSLDKIIAHSERSPQSVRAARKDVPRGLAHLLDHMLAKDPADRPPKPAAVAEALQVIERKLVPCPRFIKLACWLWIIWGVLSAGVFVGGGFYLNAHQPSLRAFLQMLFMGALVGGPFIYKGRRTLQGKEAGTAGNGFGSIVFGLFLGLVAFVLVSVRSIAPSLGPFVVVVPVALSSAVLVLAGVRLIMDRRAYLAWVRRKQLL
jgi:tRNA A-37 threonylcarbamoyl transferase component Bud32